MEKHPAVKWGSVATQEESDGKVEVRSYFVRERNAMAVRADFGPIYMDYYLHLMQHSMQLEPDPDQLLKDAIAAFTLHLASKPWQEVVAWTLNLQDPLLNLFVTGDSRLENVVGRIFTDDVRKSQKSQFFSQVNSPQAPVRQSSIEVEGTNYFRIAEQYYLQSEQRVGRYFSFSEEEIVLVSAQPQCDVDWLQGLTDEAILTLDKDEDLSLLESRTYHFSCGCNSEKILPVIAPMASKDISEFFGGENALDITCPRCGAQFQISRSQVEAYLGQGE